MKKNPIIFSLSLFFLFNVIQCFGNNVSDTLKLPQGQNGSINLILGGIEEKKADVKTAETALADAKSAQSIQLPDLQAKKNEKEQEANNIYAAHNNVHVKGSPEYNYWQGQFTTAQTAAKSFANDINNLQKNVDDAQAKKDEAETALKETQKQLLDFVKMNSNSDCAKQLSSDSPIEAIVQCWNCLFDNNCGNYGAPPRSPVDQYNSEVPVKNYGAPPIMGGAFHNAQLSDIYSRLDKTKVPPLPPPPPPQKGTIEQATDKIRSYFRDVINNSRRINIYITRAVAAVRG